MPTNEKFEEDFKPLEGQEVYRLQRFVLAIGLIGLAIAAGVGLIAFFVRDQLVGILILSALFAGLSIPIVVSYLVTRLYVDDEGIEHRNGIGVRRRINWRDVEAVYTENSINIIIKSKWYKIKIEPGYQNADRIISLVTRNFPDAFSTKAVKTGVRGVWTEGEASVFRRKRFYGVIGIIMLLIGVGFLFVPDESRYLISMMYGVPGLLIFLSYASARAYVDDEKIAYRNLIGYKKQIRWEDIRSVKNVYRSGLLIKSADKRIKVSWGFAGYDLLCAIVAERRPKRHKTGRTNENDVQDA